jgi:hypothetical protein
MAIFIQTNEEQLQFQFIGSRCKTYQHLSNRVLPTFFLEIPSKKPFQQNETNQIKIHFIYFRIQIGAILK